MRLLLVEDDPAIRRFVTLALEDMTVDLRTAGTLAEAQTEVALQAPDLLFTDLTLPDGDGMSLLERACREPRWLGDALVVVFSARVSAESRRRALSLGAWRMLDKPVPLQTLADCVREARTLLSRRSPACPAAPAIDAPTTARPGAGLHEAPLPSEPEARDGIAPPMTGTDVAVQAAIAQHFGGQRELYDAFASGSNSRLRADLEAAADAVARADWQALGRTAHSLRTVMQLLGAPAAASAARHLELACASPGVAAPVMAALWATLAEQLEAWLARPA